MRTTKLSASTRLVFAPLLILLFCLFTRLPSAFAQCNPAENLPYTQSVGAVPGDKVTISVTALSGFYDCSYDIEFYNSAGVYLGRGSGLGRCETATYTFGPFCSTDQTSLNVSYVIIRKGNNFPLQILSVNVSKVPDSEIAGSPSGTNAGAAQEVSCGQTLAGSLTQVFDPNFAEQGKFWKMHLEKGEKLGLTGWATSETVGNGAELSFDITYDGTNWAGVADVAPYGTYGFTGAYTANQSGLYTIRARCLAWTICKFVANVSVSGRQCPPPYACPCSLHQGGANQPVELFHGRERSTFAPDLTIHNPVGPAVTFSRSWTQSLALEKYRSPGLTRGWTHSYDVRVSEVNADDLQIVFPNGGEFVLTAKRDGGGNLTGGFSAPSGAPYDATAVAATVPPGTIAVTMANKFQSVEVVDDSGTKWKFVPSGNRYEYRLDRLTVSTGQYLSFFYNASKQLEFIKNQSSTTLLTLAYQSGLLSSATDIHNRRVRYNWQNATGTSETALWQVSQLHLTSDTGTIPTFQTYLYSVYASKPMLATITTRHPNGGSGTSSSTNLYDSQGRVASTTDGNGVKSVYTYGTNQALVQIKNSGGTVIQQFTRYQHANGIDAGYSNNSGDRWYVYYDDANNPLQATRHVDPDGRTYTYTYDSYGHLKTVTAPSGIKLTYTWTYTNWRFGRLTQMQKSVGGTTLPATSVSYYEPSGLPNTVTSPHPNGSGTVFSTRQYDTYGNITQLVTSGDTANPTRTTLFYYTTDGSYTQPMVVGRPVLVVESGGDSTHLRYDTQYNLYSLTDELGKTTTVVNNFANQPLRVIFPATGQTGSGQGELRYNYAYNGGAMTMAQVYNESGSPVRTFNRTYGLEGELLSASGNEIAESYQYDALYRLKKFIDGSAHETTYTYDGDGRVTEVTYPNGTVGGSTAYDRERVTSYSDSGRPLQTIDGRGTVANYTYGNADGKLTAIAFPATTYENQTRSYDSFGRLQEVDDYTGLETYAYNQAENLSSVSTTYQKADFTNMTTWTQSYVYNADGNRNRLTTPLGNLDYTYDSSGRLSALKGINSTSTTWSYLDNGWLNNQTLPVNVRSNATRNDAGQALAVANYRINPTTGATTEVLSQWGVATDPLNALLYNASGQMVRRGAATTATYNFGGNTTYSYDARALLSNETSAAGIGYNHSFSYDNAANPTSWKGQTRTFNINNQETTGSAFDYNGDGSPWRYLNRNLTDASNPNGTSQILSYNTSGQLRQINTAVGTAAGALVAKYGYRGDAKRAWKESASGVRTYYYYDGDMLLGTSGETANSASVLLWGADGLVGTQTKPTSTTFSSSYFLYDPQGNLVQTVGGDGVVYNAQAFTAWGDVVPRADGSIPNVGTFGYGAKYGYIRDSESGFYLCTYRHYDPRSGRWITRDPIGYAGGSNLYGYVDNDPANATDPSGLSQDMGGPSGTVRFSLTTYIPYGQVMGPGAVFKGDGRGPSYNSIRFKTQLNGRIDLKNHTVQFDDPDVNPTIGIGGQASKYIGQADYLPAKWAIISDCGYRINISGNSHNPFYTYGPAPLAKPISHNVTIDFDNDGNVVAVHGVRSGFPSMEFWTYRNGRAPHLAYNFDVRALKRTSPFYLGNTETF